MAIDPALYLSVHLRLDPALEARCRALAGADATIQYCSEINARPDMPCWFLLHQGSSVADPLVAVLSVFAPRETEAEISAYVAADWRRRGLFRHLLAQAGSILQPFGYQRLLLVSEQGASPASHITGALELDHSEYAMELDRTNQEARERRQASVALLDQRQAGSSDRERLAAIQAAAFCDDSAESAALIDSFLADPRRRILGGWHQGTMVACGALYEDKAWSINALSVDPALQGRGFGRAMLAALVGACPADQPVVLDVDTTNQHALSLYQSLGFAICRAVDYHLLPAFALP